MRRLIVLVGLVATPAVAQMTPAWDPVMAGQGAALTAMNKRNAERLAAARRGQVPAKASASAAAPKCDDAASLGARRGSLSRDDYQRWWSCTHGQR